MFMLFYFRMRNKELIELRTHNIADQSVIYEIIDKEQDERRDETFSEIKSPPTTDTTNNQSKVEGLTTESMSCLCASQLIISCQR